MSREGNTVPTAWACGARAWQLVWAAPAPHLIGGFLLLALSGTVPVLGTLFCGPVWVGMCAVSLKSLRGESPQPQDLFAPFGDKRLLPSLLYGGVITAIMTVSGLVSMSWISMLAMQIFGGRFGPDTLGLFTGQMVLALLVALLPLVFIAYYLFPAGFYIAAGETNIGAALGKGARAVWARRGFWSAFWGVMMLGHLAGMLTCCIGLIAVMPWNCLAMGAALVAQDASLLEVSPIPPQTN